MIVFDASGSMSGNMVQGLFSAVTRIDEVRKALAQVLPAATKFRKVGLITYGPGPYAQCNVELNFPPIPNAAERIMRVVNALNPAGKTPLVDGVMAAAKVLQQQSERGVIVLLTDGEETCGGAPCALGKVIKADGRLTVHVIGYQLRGFSWTGAQSILDVECLAEETGGLYITANNRQDLIKAFEKTLGCPMMSSVGACRARRGFARSRRLHRLAARIARALSKTEPPIRGRRRGMARRKAQTYGVRDPCGARRAPFGAPHAFKQRSGSACYLRACGISGTGHRYRVLPRGTREAGSATRPSASSWQGLVVVPGGAPRRPSASCCEKSPRAPHPVPRSRHLMSRAPQ